MGVGETAKGIAKEKVGQVVNDDDLEAEGRAQRTKGNEETQETEDRVKAQAHEKKAQALQEKQESLER